MTEYELQDAFLSCIDMGQVYFLSFISATSAFLVVAHLAAKTISSNLTKLAVGLYSFTAIFYLGNFQRAFTAVIAFRDKMAEANMSWHPAVADPQWVMPVIMWMGVTIMILFAFSSVVYFISARKRS